MSSVSSVYRDSFVPLKPITRLAHQDEDRLYRYNEEVVEVIVVFDEGDSRIAIVENSKGEQFDVPMSDLERV